MTISIEPVSMAAQVQSWRGKHCTSLLWEHRHCAGDKKREWHPQLLPAGCHLPEFRLGCNRCILLWIWKSWDTNDIEQHVNGSLSASLFTYLLFLCSFLFLHFLFISVFSCSEFRTPYSARSADDLPWPRFFVLFSAVPRRWNQSICT